MFAAVDLGSNSFRLHVGHYDGKTIRIIKSAREPIRHLAAHPADRVEGDVGQAFVAGELPVGMVFFTHCCYLVISLSGYLVIGIDSIDAITR